eukprot:TRINITY_DN37195_c0_g1_i1.p1 TRINITY_DN37195_c0_g1~~TRINITY_DN37195_c0_g1_i1.p1  ORF type:complete len:198 (-),score=51.23 TRINITY_DN37195_c0_g1_i1:179-772(-)
MGKTGKSTKKQACVPCGGSSAGAAEPKKSFERKLTETTSLADTHGSVSEDFGLSDSQIKSLNTASKASKGDGKTLNRKLTAEASLADTHGSVSSDFGLSDKQIRNLNAKAQDSLSPLPETPAEGHSERAPLLGGDADGKGGEAGGDLESGQEDSAGEAAASECLAIRRPSVRIALAVAGVGAAAWFMHMLSQLSSVA